MLDSWISDHLVRLYVLLGVLHLGLASGCSAQEAEKLTQTGPATEVSGTHKPTTAAKHPRAQNAEQMGDEKVPHAPACGQGAAKDPTNPACEGPSARVCVLAYDGVLSSDVTAPLEVFGAAQKFFAASVDTRLLSVGHTSDLIRTAEGLQLKADEHIEDAAPCDAIIVPGAHEKELRRAASDARVLALVQRHMSAGARVASNCAGAFILSMAGALNDRRATTFTGGAARLAAMNPSISAVEDAKIIVDGPLMTSKGSLVSYGAALLLLSQMKGEKVARQVFDHLQFPQLGSWEQFTAH